MTHGAKPKEPSMAEILASIRRIIAEDEPEKSARHPAEAASVGLNPAAVAASVEAARGGSYSPPSPKIGALAETAKAAHSSTDLTEPMASSASRFDAPAVNSSPAPVPPAPIDQAVANEAATQSGVAGGAQEDERSGLMSSATGATIDSAFNALAQTVLVHNARTLEDLIREMLRPMLKVWLDDNMPGIVERLVRTEIDRVSRGRGG